MSSQNEKVKGLTTAATIWVVAAVGLACGAGMLLESLAATVLVLFVLVLIPFIERAILPHPSSSIHHLHIEATSISGKSIASIYDICARNKVTIEKLRLQAEKEGEALGLICRVPSEETLAKVVSELRTLPEVSVIHANLYGTGVESPTSEGSIS